jgi:hypothetical protein
MARARNIKPGFFTNEDLAECTPWARLCFAGLWTLADREGRLEDRPKRIKGQLFALDSIEVEPLLGELVKHGFILRYAANGSGFIQILAFSKHQTPHHKEAKSVIPSPESLGLLPHATNEKPQAFTSCDDDEAQDKPEASSPRNGEARGQNPSDSLIPDSLNLIPDCPNSVGGASPPEKQKRKTRLPADFELTTDLIAASQTYWRESLRPDLSASDEFEKFVAHHTSRGSTMLDWNAAWKTWYCNAIKFNKPPMTLIAGGNHANSKPTPEPFSTTQRRQAQRALEELDREDREARSSGLYADE